MCILDPNEETFVFPAEVPPVILEESKVPEYVLPDPLFSLDGEEITTAEQWVEKRRPELLELFKKHIYGRVPLEQMRQSNLATKSEIADKDENALGGKATRLQMEITLTRDDPNWRATNKRGQMINVLIYLPNRVNGEVPQPGTVPAFIGYNFVGNHSIVNDPGIDLPLIWIKKENDFLRVQAEESTRGGRAARWPVEKIIDSGFALITAYYGDVVPDFPGGRKEGIQGVFDKEEKTESTGDEWGAIAAWAWGLSIISSLAALEQDAEVINWEKIAVVGHSRLGKTALWAGATDERFALVISNNSGCGGAALSRREFGETIWRMNTVFPHWLSGSCKEYNARINDCPVDQHELIALIAPRPVYVASATEDSWADPKGEFLSCLYADPVYKLLGTEGLGDVTEMPDPDTPVGKTIQYHNRTGKHNITGYDWDQYIRFAKEHFEK
ncbi:MAG: acetylxylan esterase [Planctomycetaceae bacterium]|nr:acetylxylan esterase [Planctomycetaceae bacterium]